MHPSEAQGRGLLVRPQRTRWPGPWYHPGLARGLGGLILPIPSKGGKYLLTEFLVNDLWGIMAGGKDAYAVRSGKARVSLISTKEKGGSSNSTPVHT